MPQEPAVNEWDFHSNAPTNISQY